MRCQNAILTSGITTWSRQGKGVTLAMTRRYAARDVTVRDTLCHALPSPSLSPDSGGWGVGDEDRGGRREC